MRTLKVTMVLAVMVGCGPEVRDPSDPGNHGSNSPDGGGSQTGTGIDSASGSGACSDSAKLVYTVDQNETLSQFDPSSKTFHDLGTLACSATAQPYSMGVDRNTIGWVNYSDGSLYRVDILNGLTCTKTSWASSNGLINFGMGFSANVAGSTDDTLFIAGGFAADVTATSMLASLDTTSMAATTLGTVMGWPELTGNANAELWGWFPSDATGATMPRVDQIDKTSGASITSYPLPTLKGSPSAWAFAYWGGDYWVFLKKDGDLGTIVYQIDGANGSIKGTTPTTLRAVVGAGVSTCAPTVIL